MRPAFRFVLLILVLALTAAACGDDEEGESSTTLGATTTLGVTTTLGATTTLGGTTVGVPSTVLACSAHGMAQPPEDPALPAEVAATRAAIANAAIACDYDALGALASWEFFMFAVGSSGDPVAFWQQEEQSGLEPLRYLVATLGLPWARAEAEGDVQYLWPAAAMAPSWDQVPADEQAALVALYGTEVAQDWTVVGGFAGYRVSIGLEGTWAFFVAGD